MEVDAAMYTTHPNTQDKSRDNQNAGLGEPFVPSMAPQPSAPMPHDNFREIQVKVHIRKPERDTWAYLGRGIVTQEVAGRSSRVVIRAISTGKVMASFGETSDIQAEKRGNFIVIGCVEASHVMSWSLNALNNSETLRLLATIELACHKFRETHLDPHLHSKTRRRIERLIKDDRRKRHRRRKDQDAMVDAFAKQTLSNDTVNIGPSVSVA